MSVPDNFGNKNNIIHIVLKNEPFRHCRRFLYNSVNSTNPASQNIDLWFDPAFPKGALAAGVTSQPLQNYFQRLFGKTNSHVAWPWQVICNQDKEWRAKQPFNADTRRRKKVISPFPGPQTLGRWLSCPWSNFAKVSLSLSLFFTHKLTLTFLLSNQQFVATDRLEHACYELSPSITFPRRLGCLIIS